MIPGISKCFHIKLCNSFHVLQLRQTALSEALFLLKSEFLFIALSSYRSCLCFAIVESSCAFPCPSGRPQTLPAHNIILSYRVDLQVKICAEHGTSLRLFATHRNARNIVELSVGSLNSGFITLGSMAMIVPLMSLE
jgi:hypothetical protein